MTVPVCGLTVVAVILAQAGPPVPRSDNNSRIAHEQLTPKSALARFVGCIDDYGGYLLWPG